ncbi:MAG TPA: SDR family oxidoreductase [Planctomycetota bacterium]|nr:SDR family oxidoreductase [Planctomycetota bacterium]
MASTLFDLTGKTALITGGSRGLGRAMARGFAEAGADVLITSRHEDELRGAVDIIGKGLSRRVERVVCDMTDLRQVDALAPTAVARLGRVDILVNNAGTNIPQPIDQITDEAWETTMLLNLTSVMRLTRALVPPMKERRWGRIIHISSVLGLGGKEGRNSYCATKAALTGLARASALDLGPFNVTVNCIAPGPFLTDLPGKLLNDEQKKHFAARTALGRWGRPEEIVGPALMLASDAGSYVTGNTLVVDGGNMAKTL